MARRFGFGGTLGLDIPGERGRADPDPRLEAGDDRHALADGRDADRRHRPGLDLATPLQLATMAARLVTGRAVVPPSGAPRRHGCTQGGDKPAAAISAASASTRATWRWCSTA